MALCVAGAVPLAALGGERCADFRNVSSFGQLLDMTVSSVLRDSTGYVWLGNGLGVDRFDGVRVRHYPIPGSDIKYRRVNALAQAGGSIFAGNGDGLWLLDGRTGNFEPAFSGKDGMSSIGTVNVLHATAGGDSLLVGTSTGLYKFAPGAAAPVQIALADSRLGSPASRISDIAVAGDTIFLATEAGVMVIDDGYPILYEYPEGFNSVAVAGGRLFLGTSGAGIVTFDRKTGVLTPYPDLGGNVVTDLATDARGRLYAATDGAGVIVVDTATDAVVDRYINRPGRDGGLSSNAVYAVYCDGAGLLWVGYYQLGASYTLYSAGLFSVYAHAGFNTVGRGVRVVKRHGPYTLVGTRDGVAIIDERDDAPARLRLIEAPVLRTNMIISAVWHGGRFVVGTYGGGLHILDPATGAVSDASSSDDNPFRTGHIFSLTTHPDGSLWCGTSAGLYHFSKGAEARHWTSDNSPLPPGNIYAIFFDSKGNGWICTENGLAVYDPARRTISSSVFPKGFPSDRKFKEVFEDRAGRLYFLPEHGDIYVSNISMTEFGPLDTPLSSEQEPRAVIEDSDGCLWLATSNGIFSRAQGGEWVEYGSTDGVVSPLFINCTPILDEQGRLWFGNSRGLLMVRPHDAHDGGKVRSFQLQLSEVLVNGAPLEHGVPERSADGGYRVEFPRHAGSITLRLSPMNFADPANLHYQYRLDDGDWQDLDRTFDLSFYDLPGGTHTLHLRQAGRPDTETDVEMSVPQPAWVWICLFASLVAVLSVIGYARHVRRISAVHAAARSAAAGAADAEPDEAANAAEAAQRKYKTYTMRDDEGRDITARLDRIMAEGKPYTNPELRLADLAELAGVSGHKLSFYFSQYLHQSFYDYVNLHRIAEFKRLAAGPDADRYTLAALSSRAGFSSRTSFFRHFKKVEGITPAEYVERLKK